MRDKLNQFISNLNGQFVEVSYKPAEYQCMDLAYVWVFCLDIPKATIQHEFAFEVYQKASDFTRQYFDIIPKTPEFIPQTGDLFVMKGGTAGHIGLVIEATITRMKTFEQNNPIGTNAHIQDRNYTNVLGFLRPKFSTSFSLPQWFSTLLQERGLTLKNESEIRVIFDKSKKYDDEVKNLQEQLKSANETLADKSIEVSSLLTKNQSLQSRVDELEILYTGVKSERDDFQYKYKASLIKVEELEDSNDKKEQSITELSDKVKELQNDAMFGMTLWEIIKTIFRKKK